MARDLNRVGLTCRLTRDPELRHTPSGTAVCSMRVAFTTSRKAVDTGEWTDKSNYMDVTVWGNQGESCATHLAKGRRIAIDGRLEWREWEAQDGTKRQTVEIIAEGVIFLDYAEGRQNEHTADQDSFVPAGAGAGSFEPAGVHNDGGGDFAPAATGDDDIPF